MEALAVGDRDSGPLPAPLQQPHEIQVGEPAQLAPFRVAHPVEEPGAGGGVGTRHCRGVRRLDWSRWWQGGRQYAPCGFQRRAAGQQAAAGREPLLPDGLQVAFQPAVVTDQVGALERLRSSARRARQERLLARRREFLLHAAVQVLHEVLLGHPRVDVIPRQRGVNRDAAQEDLGVEPGFLQAVHPALEVEVIAPGVEARARAATPSR